MYACLHTRSQGQAESLLEIARQFSPVFEQTQPGTVVFAIDPLRKLIGSPHQIAAEICRLGYEREIAASLAIASTVDAAILLAQHTIGVILVTPGEERLKLAQIPLPALMAHAQAFDSSVLAELRRWGLRTCEDLAALPEQGIRERLGGAGSYLWKLASGLIDRPLRALKDETGYSARVSLDHAVVTLEPLLFVFARLLKELCARMDAQSRAARCLTAILDLGGKEFRCTLEFPVPLREPQSLLKLLQLHLERHAPDAPVMAVGVHLETAAPRRSQSGLFLPLTPVPDKLQLTVSRIAGLVGTANVGIPSLPNTHRPDAFEMNQPCERAASPLIATPPSQLRKSELLRVAIRLFRPPLEAQVVMAKAAPCYVKATGVKGNVVKSAGPWKTSGEWWAATAWVREEWDLALDDGTLYRVYLQKNSNKTAAVASAPVGFPRQDDCWYVAGIYD